MRIRQLRDRRLQLVQQIRAISDAAGANALTAEQQQEFDRLEGEVRSLAKDIEREERLVEEERQLAASGFQNGQGQPGNGQPPAGGTRDSRSGQGADEGRSADGDLADDEAIASITNLAERRSTFRERRRAQLRALIGEQRQNPRASQEYRQAFRGFLRGEVPATQVRALQAGTNAEGGFLVAPLQMAAMMIQAADNVLWLRQLATVETVATAASLGVVSLDTDPDDADWTSELRTGAEDNAMAFGRRQLTPHPLAKRIKISNRLLALSSRAEALVVQRLAYKRAVSEEKAYLLGDGAQKPLGMFVPSIDGIPTTRDVVTGAATNAFTYEHFVNTKYSLRAMYRRSAGWLLHRDGIRQAMLLKDSAGLPLWQPSLQAGQPDQLLGHTIYESEYVPNTFATGQYVGLFGDFSHYLIADSMAMQLKRLDELYAETNQTGFILRSETDGQPTLAEAFARLRLA